jgi:tRNA(adenine34) deaminase
MMCHEDFMKEALLLAKESAKEGEVPVGAVVVCDGKIVGTGRNRRETEKNALCHAEIEAINNACKTLGGWRLFKCDLYVTLEPCPMCAGALVHCRPDRVVFGIPDPKGGACGGWINLLDSNPPLNHKCEVQGGVLGDACLEQFQSFFRAARAAAKERKRREREELNDGAAD